MAKVLPANKFSKALKAAQKEFERTGVNEETLLFFRKLVFAIKHHDLDDAVMEIKFDDDK